MIPRAAAAERAARLGPGLRRAGEGPRLLKGKSERKRGPLLRRAPARIRIQVDS